MTRDELREKVAYVLQIKYAGYNKAHIDGVITACLQAAADVCRAKPSGRNTDHDRNYDRACRHCAEDVEALMPKQISGSEGEPS